MTGEQENKGVRVLYKKMGETPLQCVERFVAEHPEHGGESLTYAGRLDPMAEGVLVVLSGEAARERGAYMSLDKEYRFDVLWGVETDTADILGKVIGQSGVVPSESAVREVANGTRGKMMQVYPAYSSRPVSGKPLFQWAREGRLGQVQIPTHEVEVFDMTFISRRNMPSKELLAEIEKRISLVSGDFRQAEIIEIWKKIFTDSGKICTIDTLSCAVGSGFYVRQFVSDLAHRFDTHATTYRILRTRVGEYRL